MFCSKCGSANPDTASSCSLCGTPLGVPVEHSAPVASARIGAPVSKKLHNQTMLGVAMPGVGNQLPPSPPRGPYDAPPPPPPAPAQHHPTLSSPMVAPPAAPFPGPTSTVTPMAGGFESAGAPASLQKRPGTLLGVAAPAPGSQRAPTAPVVAQTPDRIYASLRSALMSQLRTLGEPALDDAQGLATRLRADLERDISLIVTAQIAGIPRELQMAARMGQLAGALDHGAHRLVQQFRLQPGDARFAVESWAVALGLMQG